MLYPEPLESPVPELFLDDSYQLVVYDILVDMAFPVIYVHVGECVDIEIHLVVGAHPVIIDPEQRQLCKYVVYRGNGHFCLAVPADCIGYHVCRGMSQLHHRLMHRQPLCSGFQ